MLGKEVLFVSQFSHNVWDQFDSSTTTGQALRGMEARRILQAFDRHEPEFQARDAQVRQITDRMERISAAQRLNWDYVLTFGIEPRDRHFLRELLVETFERRNLTPEQLLVIAKTRAMVQDYQ